MHSLSTRLFAATLSVSLVGLAIGTWWVRRAVQIELDRHVTIEHRVVAGNDGAIVEEIARDVRLRVDSPADGLASVSGAHGGAMADALNRRIVIALTIVILGAALVTAVVSQRVLGPVRALRTAGERWSRGDFRARVDVAGHDELATLGRAFNAMAEQLDAQERIKRDLTNDVAHELRTPLTNLRCHIEALQDSVVAAGPDTWATIAADVATLERLARDLGELAQAETRQLLLAPEPVQVGAVIDGLRREMAPRAAAAGLTLTAAVAADAPTAWVDRGRLEQVLRSLVDNAIAHTPAGGRITLAAESCGDGVTIRVADTGVGIDAEHLPHIYDRFYRIDSSRSRQTGGAGLGLAIARQIVLASGGAIEASSTPGEGTTFAVTVPGRAS
jgi:two-component system, OmpR family, sensor histidine kinase BaeS